MMDIAFDRQLSPETPPHAGAVAAGVGAVASPGCRRPPAGLAGTLGQTAKIMIVDDEPVNVKVVQKHLKLAGYQYFVTSTDPRPVMDMIVRETPDVVLLDVMMPVVSGLDILRAVREDGPLDHIPVIVLTASDTEETRMEALNRVATDFLGKPVQAAELVLRVRNALLVKRTTTTSKSTRGNWKPRSASAPPSWPPRGWS